MPNYKPILLTIQPNNPLVKRLIIQVSKSLQPNPYSAVSCLQQKTEIPLIAVNRTFYHMKPPHFLLPNNKQRLKNVCFYLCYLHTKQYKKGDAHRTPSTMFPQMIYAISFSTKPLTQQIERNACSRLTRPQDINSEKSV